MVGGREEGKCVGKREETIQDGKNKENMKQWNFQKMIGGGNKRGQRNKK